MLFLFCFHRLPFSKIINNVVLQLRNRKYKRGFGEVKILEKPFQSENAELTQFLVIGNTAWLTLFSIRGSRPGRPSQIPIRTTDIRQNRLPPPLFPNPDSSVSGHLTISPWWMLLILVISGLIII